MRGSADSATAYERSDLFDLRSCLQADCSLRCKRRREGADERCGLLVRRERSDVVAERVRDAAQCGACLPATRLADELISNGDGGVEGLHRLVTPTEFG